ncbi:hypothetical protein NDU88_003048 [Pleurodeles waltl]|uniref:t-SNARE coiled-coil homology domain-containing protein n=1 Tax=Pleurodeles waltl TaxID=8319 RepID=A0AAV7T3Z9_PLEWA|nr:hypothetical protein NDU88_003048 [Pleurodeles waltl]
MLVLAEEPSSAEPLAAIQGSRVVLERKIEAVAVEMNLLWTDLRKVSDKVKVAEGSIVDLQMEMVGDMGQGWHGRSVRSPRGAACASGVDDMDWRKRRESQTQISAQRADISNGRVENQQDDTMAVVVPEMAADSIEPSDA